MEKLGGENLKISRISFLVLGAGQNSAKEEVPSSKEKIIMWKVFLGFGVVIFCCSSCCYYFVLFCFFVGFIFLKHTCPQAYICIQVQTVILFVLIPVYSFIDFKNLFNTQLVSDFHTGISFIQIVTNNVWQCRGFFLRKTSLFYPKFVIHFHSSLDN